MKIFVPALLLATLAPVAATLGAPAKKPAAKSQSAKVSVDPKARALFARAIAFYKPARTLSVAWTITEDGVSTPASFDLDRAGRLRFADNNLSTALTVIDGKTMWTLDLSGAAYGEAAHYQRDAVEAGGAPLRVMLMLEAPLGLSATLVDWLSGDNTLDAGAIAAQMRGMEYSNYRVALLPAQPLGGVACDIVRVSTKATDPDGEVDQTQTTYWFARGDGRLMRFQERALFGSTVAQDADSRITAQKINVTFAPDTFKFVPPQGAVEDKD